MLTRLNSTIFRSFTTNFLRLARSFHSSWSNFSFSEVLSQDPSLRYPCCKTHADGMAHSCLYLCICLIHPMIIFAANFFTDSTIFRHISVVKFSVSVDSGTENHSPRLFFLLLEGFIRFRQSRVIGKSNNANSFTSIL